MCWLFVCCLFLLIPPPLWKQPLPHPLICLARVFAHSAILSHALAHAHRHKQTSLWGKTSRVMSRRLTSCSRSGLPPITCHLHAAPHPSTPSWGTRSPSHRELSSASTELHSFHSKPRAHVGYEIGPGTKCATFEQSHICCWVRIWQGTKKVVTIYFQKP